MRIQGRWLWRVTARIGGGGYSRGLIVRREHDRLPGFAKVFDFRALREEGQRSPDVARASAWAFRVELKHLRRAIGASHVVELVDWRTPGTRGDGVLVFEQAIGSAATLAPASANEVQEAIDDAARGLRQLHRRGIVHQDLKAANLLRVEREGEARWVLGDLGRASSADCWGPFAHHWVVGDRAWAPPELLFGAGSPGWRARGRATDIWLLGALAFELLVGQPLTAWLWEHVPERARPAFPDAPTDACPRVWAREQRAWSRAIVAAAREVQREARRRGATPAGARDLRDDFLARCAPEWRLRRLRGTSPS